MSQTAFPLTQFNFADTTPVASGYVVVGLNKDAVSTSGQIVANNKVKLSLNTQGVVTGTEVFWPNNELTPTDTVYIFSVYTEDGKRILGPLELTIGEGSGLGFGQAFGSSFGS